MTGEVGAKMKRKEPSLRRWTTEGASGYETSRNAVLDVGTIGLRGPPTMHPQNVLWKHRPAAWQWRRRVGTSDRRTRWRRGRGRRCG